MACFSDQGPTMIKVAFPAEALHELRTEPARSAVELVLAQGMARYDMDAMPFFYQAERHLDRRDTTADDYDGLAYRRPTVEPGFEDMMDACVTPRRPIWPLGLFARAYGQYETLRSDGVSA